MPIFNVKFRFFPDTFLFIFQVHSARYLLLERCKRTRAIPWKIETGRSSRVSMVWWHSANRDVLPGWFQPYIEELHESESVVEWYSKAKDQNDGVAGCLLRGTGNTSFFIFHFVIHFLRCLSAMSPLKRKGPGGEEEVLGTPRHGRLWPSPGAAPSSPLVGRWWVRTT